MLPGYITSDHSIRDHAMPQFGLFDCQKHLTLLEKAGAPLIALNKMIEWEQFRLLFDRARENPRKTPASDKGDNSILLFKILLLQSLRNLSDKDMEYQILDRYSFPRSLGICQESNLPDVTAIFRFWTSWHKQVIDLLFSKFDQFHHANGFQVPKGQIVDASIVRAPTQRNAREENKDIKAGKSISPWSKARRRQKDTDTRWTKKNGKAFFGYKNHVSIDAGRIFIRSYEVTDASAYDSQVFTELLDPSNTNMDAWADSAYRFHEHIQRKACQYKKLTTREHQGNRNRARTRCRIEHGFGFMAMRTDGTVMGGISMARIRAKIGLRNIACNMT